MSGIALKGPKVKKRRLLKEKKILMPLIPELSASTRSESLVKTLPNSSLVLIWSYLTPAERQKIVRSSKSIMTFFNKNIRTLEKLDKEKLIEEAKHCAERLRGLCSEAQFKEIKEKYKNKEKEAKVKIESILKEQVFKYQDSTFQITIIKRLLQAVSQQEEEEQLFTGLLFPAVDMDLPTILIKFKQVEALRYLLESKQLEKFYRNIYSNQEAYELIESLQPELLSSVEVTSVDAPVILLYLRLLLKSKEFNCVELSSYLTSSVIERFNEVTAFLLNRAIESVHIYSTPSKFLNFYS